MACPALSDEEEIHFPTLAELNAEISEWDPEEEDAMLQDEAIYNDTENFAVTRSRAAKSPGLGRTKELAPNPTPPIQAPPAPRVPEIGPLTANILRSSDRLFFYCASRAWIYNVRVVSCQSRFGQHNTC